ncbi:MAG: U32 family peptidase [Clostridia bacterium]|nr:U32 family peptidase [Clostridia bacterium]MBQ8792112.1 U32 family peptidase [Clostridia bacterium]
MELLAPAGNFDKLQTAVHFGADAVYFAGKKLGLRAFAGNFSEEEIFKAMLFLHARNKKGYITLNIVANDSDFEEIDDYLKLLVDAKVDGVIVSDLGLISYIRSKFPSLNVHVSTQANVNNSQTAKVYADMGCTRIVLARELSLKQINEIYKAVGDRCEIETFVHGAMCISYSGRCLLSNYLTGRESNRGACVQACRWKYFIREENRDDEMEIQQDERGTYILNSKDLCLIDHLKELEKAGIESLKIEGRMKSDYYVASVVNAYRRALDGKNDMQKLQDELEKTSHRRYTTGFYFGEKDKEYLEDSMPVQTAVFIAKVVEEERDGLVKIEMRNRFKKGDTLEILSADENFLKTITIEKIINSKGEEIEDAKRVQEILTINCPYNLKAGDILRVNKN